MPSTFARTILFLSAYIPLYLLMAFYASGWSIVLTVVLCVASLVIFLFTFYFFQRTKNINLVRLDVSTIARRDSDVVAYIITFVAPLLVTPSDDWRKWVGVLVFFLVTGALQVRLNVVYTNPLIALLGYFSYEVTTKQGVIHLLLSRRRAIAPGELYAAMIGDGIFAEVENVGRVTVPTH